MPSVNDIKRAARKADGYKDDINAKKRYMKKEIDNLRSWWEGEASTSFTNRYSNIDSNIRKIEKNIENVEYYLKRLAEVVDDVEEERRIRALLSGK